MKPLTLELFRECTGAPQDRAEMFYEPTLAAMERFEISELTPVAGFLANVAIESNRLQSVEESLYYKDPERVARIYLRVFDKDHDRAISPEEVEAAKPYCCNHAALSKLLYNGYHGRGLIQLTWLKNYQLAGTALDFDYVGNPDQVKQPKHAALTAAWFWQSHGCGSVTSFKACVALINPALMHLAERTTQYEHNMLALA